MRWLITGARGMVGSDLVAKLRAEDHETVPVSHGELDITDRDAVLDVASRARPDVIVNCAAFTKVDDCESERERALRVNGEAVSHLAEAANREGALLVQISTDFVFDGSKGTPYVESDPAAPLSEYGKSKLEGEKIARAAVRSVVLRTSWLFGLRGWNFVEAIRAQIIGGRRELRVVDDQRGRPTWTPHLAEAIVRVGALAANEARGRGTMHYADHGECSWYDFAREIAREVRATESIEDDIIIIPIKSAEVARPAKRPSYSVLSTERYETLTGSKPSSWKRGLTEYLTHRCLHSTARDDRK